MFGCNWTGYAISIKKKHALIHVNVYDDLGDFYTKKGILRKKARRLMVTRLLCKANS